MTSGPACVGGNTARSSVSHRSCATWSSETGTTWAAAPRA